MAPPAEPGESGEGERASPDRTGGGPADEGEPGPGEEPTELPEDACILLPVRGMAMFPGVVLPIAVGRDRSVRAIQAAVRAGEPVGVLLQREPDIQEPGPTDLYEVGTLAGILQYFKGPDGSHHVIAQGRERFRVVEYLQREPLLLARIESLGDEGDPEEPSPAVDALVLHLKEEAHRALELLPHKPEDLDEALQNTESPSALTDMVATFIELPAAEKQDILETLDLEERMRKVSEKLAHLVRVLELSREISESTKGKMEKAQREYFLREQLKTIQRELGEGHSVELVALAEAIAGAGMPEEVQREADKELTRLERMPEASAEYGMVRTYLEWMAELPWARSSEDAIDLERASAILEEDHYGLEKVKRRILEFLAVRKLKPDGRSPILCLVGPPGVGKTSLGQSVARAMGREFVRVSLGGVHDEAEIRGHRRTYVGAMPGNIIQSIRRAGTNNPVFMLDELDKLSASFHGDPSAALLEVLDPEQNHTFRDNYLGVPFDLSRSVFIGTANVLHAVPGPLRDRFEVIELSGYTEEEKLQIAKRYLVRRQTDHNGLTRKSFRITAAAVRALIRGYTREAGVRNLEREIGAVARHAAMQVARGEAELVRVDAADLHGILGPRRFESELALRTRVAGVATALAWTPVGGDILFVEATRLPGRGQLILTGQLGDVMKESARAAVSLVRADAERLGIDPEVFPKHDIHVHLPAGSIPKDGPSAGVALYTALVSLLTGRRVRSRVGMTGEISLRGLVLQVGGIKEKLLAAYRAGMRTVILPARNEKDLEELPEPVRERLTFRLVSEVSEVLEEALEPAGRRRSRARAKTGGDG